MAVRGRNVLANMMRLGGSAIVLLLLAIASDTALAQTGVIRRSREVGIEHQEAQDRLQDEIETVEGEADTSTTSSRGTSLPPLPISSPGQRTIEFSAPRSSGTASAPAGSDGITQEALDRWHVRNNVCTDEWTVDDFNSLFPTINQSTANATCG